MKINDKRTPTLAVYFKDLVVGRCYVDTEDNYVIATDEDSVVNLDSGELYNQNMYNSEVMFIPVKATLEIE